MLGTVLSGAGDIIVFIFKMSIRVIFLFIVISAFLVFMSLLMTFVYTSLNVNVLSDLFTLLQMWLPFNLEVLLTWFSVAVFGFLYFKLLYFSYSFIKNLTEA